MPRRGCKALLVAPAAVATLFLAAVPVAGQPAEAVGAWRPTRTPTGQPDMQGFWVRDTGQASPSHSLEEGAEPEARAIQGQDPREAHGNWIVQPPDGTIPYQPWAAARRRAHLVNLFAPTQPEHLDPDDRCLPAGPSRPIYTPGGFELVQTGDHVVLLFEYAHAYRVIPLDGRPHAPEPVRLGVGDSRGRWEGNTLVVDVTNTSDQSWFDSHGTFHSDDMHVVERFRMVDANTMRYEATIEDPTVFTRPWTIAVPLRRNQEAGYELWEHACHEGERNTVSILRAGRLAREAGQTGIHIHEAAN